MKCGSGGVWTNSSTKHSGDQKEKYRAAAWGPHMLRNFVLRMNETKEQLGKCEGIKRRKEVR